MTKRRETEDHEVIEPGDKRYKDDSYFKNQEPHRYEEEDPNIYIRNYGCTSGPGCMGGCLFSIIISILLTWLLNLLF
ncbi:hypothetical protein N9R04_10620 [Staphylococcus sp. SQ8-PEA]|uniref:Uncharacterized protein n=1 Tax=Staphylococcus marylandisciuri TaxID=2981529 RepID=A0ABT2QT10_9STAP|nr:hypothetical protein [Staphylococcus marylandisciuri]MCU5747112.1 hypothetical protein [Staphylococcus marylandisciuri]